MWTSSRGHLPAKASHRFPSSSASFNPDDDDFRYLHEALDVASDQKYQACRRNLYEWQQQFVRGNYTDARSIKTAVEKMNDLVHELRTATERQKRWRVQQLSPEWIMRAWFLFIASVLIWWGTNRVRTGRPDRTVGQETINLVIAIVGASIALLGLLKS